MCLNFILSIGKHNPLLEKTFPDFEQMDEEERQKLIDKIQHYIIQAVRKGLVENSDEWPYKGVVNHFHWSD